MDLQWSCLNGLIFHLFSCVGCNRTNGVKCHSRHNFTPRVPPTLFAFTIKKRSEIETSLQVPNNGYGPWHSSIYCLSSQAWRSSPIGLQLTGTFLGLDLNNNRLAALSRHELCNLYQIVLEKKKPRLLQILLETKVKVKSGSKLGLSAMELMPTFQRIISDLTFSSSLFGLLFNFWTAMLSSWSRSRNPISDMYEISFFFPTFLSLLW